MRSKGFDGMECSIASVMGALGDRWGLLVVRDLMLGVSRYEDLRRSSGVTNATLSDRLKGLEREGLVERREYQTSPLRSEYHLTSRGRQLGSVIQAMMQVGDAWRAADGREAPLRLVNARSGNDLRLAAVDGVTGERVPAADVLVTAGPAADAATHARLAHLARRSDGGVASRRVG